MFSLLLQSLIIHATDFYNYALMSSLNLSSSFDLVYTKLLIKILLIIGLPMDLVKHIKIWLTKRKFYLKQDGQVSHVLESEEGTIQRSILSPILYTIFVSPSLMWQIKPTLQITMSYLNSTLK